MIKGIWLLTIQNHFISCLHYCPTYKFYYTFELVNKARQYFTARKCRDRVTVESLADCYYYFRHINIVQCGESRQTLSYTGSSQSWFDSDDQPDVFSHHPCQLILILYPICYTRNFMIDEGRNQRRDVGYAYLFCR